ncbi:MAG: NAD(P)H-hydrate dehydratase [Eubacteriales bacterium]
MVTHENISRDDVCVLFPPLHPRTNKGDMGRVLCVCGSYDGQGMSMCGAAYFSASAAYRSGAGIVEIFTARKNYEALASNLPEAVFSLYDTEKEETADICRRLREEIKKADSVVLGCGLGRSETAKEMVRTVLSCAGVPLVIDADGLNIVSESPGLWDELSAEQKARTVITPHPGEMARLCGRSVGEILTNSIETAEGFAKERGIICLLKDHCTVITDGFVTFVNQSGNPGMATGGSGDVLSGIIGALLARKTLAEWANEGRKSLSHALYRAATAAYIHGLAGDKASEKFGQYSMTASDILSEIHNVIR